MITRIAQPLLAAAILAGAITTGCSTTGEQSTTSSITPERVEACSRFAAYATATAAMLRDPSVRPALEAAAEGITALRAQERWDLATMANIATTHGLAELISSQGSLTVTSTETPVPNNDQTTVAITGAVLFFDAIIGESLDIKTQPYAQAVICGVGDGLSLAVGSGSKSLSTLDELSASAAATLK